jgi:iron complex outermembrane recepter protein
MNPRHRHPFVALAIALAGALTTGAFAQSAPATRENAPPAAPANLPTPADVAARPGETPARQETVQLSTFTVREDQDIGYESMHTTSGMRTVQELRNVSNSISILNQQLIEDTASLTMEEMAQWFVAGEDNPEPNATTSGRVILRGIPNVFAMRNGWIWYSPMDAYTTERVELLRGPNAFLYGEADVGGAQNKITKRALFLRDLSRVKLMAGSQQLLRAELDLNRRLVRDKLAVRIAAVQHYNESWIDNVRREFRGVYGAVTYRPFPKTSISVMAEHAKSTAINSQGLFVDQFSRTATANIAASAGYVYVPAAGLLYRGQGAGRRQSTGSGLTIVDPSIVPKRLQTNGPNSTYKNYFDSVTVEAEHRVGGNLHLQVSGNFYQQAIDNWFVSAARAIRRDITPTLPNGQPNPYFNELYTEYFRIRNIHGGIVRDMRFSAVYDLNTKWTRQQFMLNLQQHQDSPGHRKPKWGEYVDHTTAAWAGAQPNLAQTQAAFTANRTLFTNNRFMRRYYFDVDGTRGSDDRGPVPGVSAWYPDLSNQIGAGGQQINRRFYTPSWGVGASGSWFKEHLFTHLGYRRDHFNMKTTFGVVRPLKDEWVVDEVPGAFPPNPDFIQYKVDGANYGVILRLNDAFAVGYNYAQSFRISVGQGNPSYRVGERQGIPVGEGEDLSARFRLLNGRIELTATHYNNYTPNGRFNPAPPVAIRDEVAAIFPETFFPTGQDYQTTTTKGIEVEMTANITRNWRTMFNVGTNKVVNEERAPLLRSFQAEAKQLNQPTPLLDEFIQTIREGDPNPGYTKARGNMFTRYTFTQGVLKGAYVGGGLNWRQPTFRGNGDHDSDPSTPVQPVWGPSYTLYSFLAGYRTRAFNRPASFALNISNLFNKEYYRSAGIGSGSWGEPRAYRFTFTTDL